MSLGHGASIVRDGLVLHLDAAGVKSYPGSGTTWTDLSGNGNDGTLFNGVGYSSNNKGYLSFDGVNDHSTSGSFNDDSNSALSVFCWVYANSLSNNPYLGTYLNWIINKRDNNSPSSNSWQLLSANSYPVVTIWDSNDNSIADTTQEYIDGSLSQMQINQWYQVGFVTEGTNGGYLNIYLNNEINYTGTLSGERGIAAKPITIGKTGWANAFYWNGRISQTMIYNRVLTADEIKQNFEALRGRYGI